MPDQSTADRLRLFIALTVPPEVKRRIEKAQSTLGAVIGDGVRWTKPEQMHLTLRFLGSVPSEHLEPLTTALRSACASFPKLKLRAEGIGFFPRARSPRVIWIGVLDEQEKLRELHRAVEAATNAFTAEAPEGRFTGHITLARVKMISRKEVDALANAAEGMHQDAFGDWIAKEAEIIRSQLSPHGSRYTTVASASFGTG